MPHPDWGAALFVGARLCGVPECAGTVPGVRIRTVSRKGEAVEAAGGHWCRTRIFDMLDDCFVEARAGEVWECPLCSRRFRVRFGRSGMLGWPSVWLARTWRRANRALTPVQAERARAAQALRDRPAEVRRADALARERVRRELLAMLQRQRPGLAADR